MLNKRQMHIIDILNDTEEWMTGKEIAKVLNVTDRTIRSDIEAINQFYDCILIEANRRLGYRIDKILLSKQDIETKEILPQTSHERCVWLIQELLFRKKEINLIQLQDRVFVSGYSIDNDLKKVKKMISDYPSLKIIRSKNHIRLEGEESDKRKLYKQLLTEETHGNFMNLNSIANLWSNFNLLEIKDIFEEICDNFDFRVKDVIFPMLMIHAGIAIERIINHNYITTKISDSKFKECLEYQISYEFFKQVSDTLHTEMVEDEICLFALLLMGKSSFNYREPSEIDIDQLVDRVIKKVKEYFDIDFSKDWDLKVGLSTHIQSLLERQKNNVNVANMYLKEIKRKYPLVFEMAIHSGRVITEVTHQAINENELAFLALHLGAAYERFNAKERYHVIAIIPHNQMLSKPCLDKLNLRFEDRMEVVKVLGFFEESTVQLYEPDLIITTVPLKHQLSIPTIQITLFVNYEDESKIFQALNLLDKNRFHDDFVTLIQELMRPDLFHVGKSYESSIDIINDLCDELIDKGIATPQYKQDVFKRERVSATSFVYGFAVPHSISVSTKESCISTVILDKPVQWGDFEVKLIVLLAIRDTDNSLLRIFFDWLSNVVTDSHKFSQLLEVKSYEEFMNLVLS